MQRFISITSSLMHCVFTRFHRSSCQRHIIYISSDQSEGYHAVHLDQFSILQFLVFAANVTCHSSRCVNCILFFLIWPFLASIAFQAKCVFSESVTEARLTVYHSGSGVGFALTMSTSLWSARLMQCSSTYIDYKLLQRCIQRFI